MAKHPPDHDPMDFSLRLKEAMEDVGEESGHGAGSRLSRRFRVSVPSATAWLTGKNLPEPPRARALAKFYGVRFEWLYFGAGPKRATEGVKEAPADYGAPLSADEQAMLRGYRAADESLRAIVDTALGIKPGSRKKR